jgi:hypothetical protein
MNLWIESRKLGFVSMRFSRREFWVVAALVCATCILRGVDVNARSMWPDEGLTIARINQGWDDILHNRLYLVQGMTTDTHPPVYFALLKVWSAFAGDSELVLKWFSVLFGVLVVPLTYVLAKRMFSRRTAIVAAGLTAGSALIEWYSHDLRMYSLVPCIAALGLYCLYVAMFPKRGRERSDRRPNWLAWVAWAVTALVGLQTHYSFAGLVLVESVLTVAWFALQFKSFRRGDQVITLLLAMGSLVVIAFALTLPEVRGLFARLASGAEWDYHFVPLDIIAMGLMRSLLFGVRAVEPTRDVFTAMMIGLGILGIILPLNSVRARPARLVLAAAAIVPVLFWFAISLIKPNYQDVRHLILVIPFWAIALARCVDVLLGTRLARRVPGRRWLGAATAAPATRHPVMRTAAGAIVLVSLVAAQIYGNVYGFDHTPGWMDDWRGMTDYVRAHWQEGDTFVINSSFMGGMLDFYMRPFETEVLPPFPLSADDPQVVAQRQQIVASHRRIWFVNTGSLDKRENGATVAWFLQNTYQRELIIFPSYTTLIRLQLFETHSPVGDALPAQAIGLAETDTGAVGTRIAGYEIQPGNTRSAQPSLWLSVYWRRAPGSTADSLSFRLLTPDGQSWADWFMPAQLGAAPADWTDGRIFRVDYLVPIPLGLPAQAYNLQLTTYAGAKAEVAQTITHPLPDGELRCCVRITNWPAMPASQQKPVWDAPDATLMKVEFPAVVRPGEIAPVVLTWKMKQAAGQGWNSVLSFDALLGGTVAGATSQPDRAAWPRGEPVREQTSFVVPPTTRPGLYRLSLGRQSADGRTLDGVLLGLMTVDAFPMSPVVDPAPVPVAGQVAELRLLGYGLSTPFARGATVEVHTYWRVTAEPQRDGVIFLHLFGPDGKYVASDDNAPEQGKRSTLTYRAGEGIDILHRLVIPADAPAGEYKLYVGVYNRDDHMRWAASQNGQPARDDVLDLGAITLPEASK